MRTGKKLRRVVMGQHKNDGLLVKSCIYTILAATSILYLNPLLYMFATSLQTITDLIDPAVNWIPSVLEFNNYKLAFEGLHYRQAFQDTILMSTCAAVIQVFSCALTGYAFARMHIPGKSLWLGLILLTFLIPQEILVIPLIMWYAKLGWYNTILPFIIPTFFAQGLKAPLFILIFRQFFLRLPHELEESARMDGAGAFRTYFTIMLPLAKPSMLVVFILSFVWHWNDYFHATLFLRGQEFMALSVQLEMLQNNLNVLSGDMTGTGYISSIDLNEPIKMAASSLIILPPLLLYMILQNYFVRGIERSGLVE
ncbi:carbohydrate ABC transporter permease [Paenibacillus sp.]|uniref:carbohydrate ABC transporter permease n=1 Tax=Paenibacillus sp. TaxID=58172 RepID=UPI002811D8C2|nr:carbohydrate ABC transporter permease [Paenibacillus sp.]